jgi:hypothetical protein
LAAADNSFHNWRWLNGYAYVIGCIAIAFAWFFGLITLCITKMHHHFPSIFHGCGVEFVSSSKCDFGFESSFRGMSHVEFYASERWHAHACLVPEPSFSLTDTVRTSEFWLGTSSHQKLLHLLSWVSFSPLLLSLFGKGRQHLLSLGR